MTGTPVPDVAGSCVGSYVITRQIAEGGMGIVYEAEHRLLGRRVALKTIRRDVSNDAALTRRIVVEARAIAALDHPGIVRLYDFGFDGSMPYLVMECVPGRTLQSLLRGGRRLQPRAVVRLLRSAAEALDHAHWNGVVHRDIKPGNLLLADDGRVMITDFGLAFVMNERSGTEPGSILGTADYIAPEQVAREQVDPRADIYALAAVAFHCVTGRPPFIGGGWVDVARKRLTEPAPLAYDVQASVPRYFSHALAMGLERDPARRPQSASELISHLTHALTLDYAKAQEAAQMRQSTAQAIQRPPAASSLIHRAAGALNHIRSA